MPASHGAAPHAVANSMFRALAVLRVIVLINTIVLFMVYRSDWARPGWGAVVMVALARLDRCRALGVRRPDTAAGLHC